MFTTLDYIIIGFALVCSIWAAIKGFVDEVSCYFGYVVGLVAALLFTTELSKVFMSKLSFGKYGASFTSYFVLFMTGFTAVKLFGMMLETITEKAHLGIVNNFLGFLLGLVEAILIAGLVETLMYSQSFLDVHKYFKQSFLSDNIILPAFNAVRSYVQGLF